jgi:uncharacterized protein (TIGR02594 family)
MQFTVRMFVTLGCVSLLAMSVPALGAPKKPHEPKAKGAVQRAAQAKSKIRAARDDRNAPPVGMAVARETSRSSFGSPVLVNEARKYMGTNPTDRTRLWCATFMNMVLAKAGYSGTNSDAAKSFAQYGRRISEPRVGAIAVLTRGKRGGHVGVVSGIDVNGNPIIISGNHNKRVGEATYARSRVIAYVMPSQNRTGNMQVADRGKSSDLGFDSPIAELIAAIEAESAPVRLPPGAQANARQVSEPVKPGPRRQIELDPAIAEFLGIKPRAQTARVAPAVQPQARPQPQPQAQPQPAPQRELRVELQSSGRVASDAGLSSRLLPVSR